MTDDEAADEAATPDSTPDESTPDEEAGEPQRRARRRRKLAQTLDDTDADWGERPDDDAHVRWLKEQRPPHWG